MNYLLLKKLKIALLIIKHTAKKYDVQLEDTPVQTIINPNIYWNDQKNKIGFIQNTLSLIKKGVIEYSDITEQEAVITLGHYMGLNIEKTHFQSLRRSVLSNNNDYTPDIFSKIKDGYKLLEQEIIEKEVKR